MSRGGRVSEPDPPHPPLASKKNVHVQCALADGRNSQTFYEENTPQLRNKYKWYANQLFDLGTNLRSLSEEAAATQAVLEQKLRDTIIEKNPDAVFDANGTYLPNE